MELVKGFDSNYRYVLVAARRARQLQSGAKALIETPTRKPCRVAEQEIHADKVDWFIPQPKGPVEEVEEVINIEK